MRIVAVLAVAGMLPLAGCIDGWGRGCNDGYWPDSVNLEVTFGSADVLYSVGVRVEGEDESLAVDFMRTVGEGIRCVAGCDQQNYRFAVFGGYFLGSTAMIRITGASAHPVPREITLRLHRDGEFASEVNVRPTFETSEPRGEGCGETENAAVVIAMP